MKHPVDQSSAGARVLQYALLAIACAALYGNFLSSPLVLDDLVLGEIGRPGTLRTILGLDLRWLPYVSIEWTRALMGDELHWLRLGNLALHVANASLLFLLFGRLFASVLPEESRVPAALPLSWLAFSGALLFALNPAAVYGVAYLIQRSILMATLFSLATWILFLEGLIRDQRRWLWASTLAYALAVFSKEHAVMAPAVALVLLLLLRGPDKRLLARVWPVFLLYAATAALVVLPIKSFGIIGAAYEPDGARLLATQHVDPRNPYPLALLTQGYLYFKYLLLWIVPNPAWMSIDMVERFAPRLWAWPETAGLIAFALYPLAALRLLWQRGRKGLLGFALLAPWLMFATEISTVRIQEIFVLYRSYLWMPCIFASLPFLVHKLAARQSAIVLGAIILALVPASWYQLTRFADPLLLWSDTLALARDKHNPIKLGRIYHNRGMAYLNKPRYEEAIRDFTEGIRLLPTHNLLYNDRALAYLMTRRYREALKDYNVAILLDPNYYRSYWGRAKVFDALGDQAAARKDYARSCALGVQEVCGKATGEKKSEISTSAPT
ncbi:MAG: tetratricopeptide repeat protein [Betaproteobacteria bacterium]|nr:tetratricopeptide repeat protein [Betaproteobacteria bacterium]